MPSQVVVPRITISNYNPSARLYYRKGNAVWSKRKGKGGTAKREKAIPNIEKGYLYFVKKQSEGVGVVARARMAKKFGSRK